MNCRYTETVDWNARRSSTRGNAESDSSVADCPEDGGGTSSAAHCQSRGCNSAKIAGHKEETEDHHEGTTFTTRRM